MIIPINSSLKDRVGSIFDRLFILKFMLQINHFFGL